MYGKIIDYEKKINVVFYNMILFLLIYIICLIFNIELFGTDDNLHLFFSNSIGWLESFIFGGIIFVTIAIQSLKEIKYKNISGLKVFLKYKSSKVKPWEFFSNMTAFQEIICILIIQVLIFICFYLNYDFLVIIISIYAVLLLFNLICKAISSLYLEENGMISKINFNSFIEDVTYKDLKKSRGKYKQDWVDFDVDIIDSIARYFQSNDYNSGFDLFLIDTEFLRKNINYIEQSGKMEYMISYYNVSAYEIALVKALELTENRKSFANKKKWIIKELTLLNNKVKGNLKSIKKENFVYSLQFYEKEIKRIEKILNDLKKSEKGKKHE